jgi:hypothetical protein
LESTRGQGHKGNAHAYTSGESAGTGFSKTVCGNTNHAARNSLWEQKPRGTPVERLSNGIKLQLDKKTTSVEVVPYKFIFKFITSF